MKLFYGTFLIEVLLLGKRSYAQAPGARPPSAPVTSIASVIQNMKKYEGYFNFLFGLQMIEEFKANPAAFKPATPAPMPAGPPIGG